MKIGIASDDQVNIAGHFGRTKGFVITEVADKKVVSKEYRLNTFSGHMQQGGEHQHGEHAHSHDAILKALNDCDVVLARGMGQRIYNDLRGVNIEAMITTEQTVDDAVTAYITGVLEDHPEKGCEH